MGEMADLIDQWGEESEYKRVEQFFFKPRRTQNMVTFKTSGNTQRNGGGWKGKQQNREKKEYITVGNLYLSYNPSHESGRFGEQTPCMFKGVYVLRDLEEETKEIVEFAVWERLAYDHSKPNDIIATGKDDKGNAVFLRVSSHDTIKFFGSIVAQASKDELGENVANFTLFDGDNSTAWSGTLQVEEGREPAGKPPAKSTFQSPGKSANKSKPKMPY
jgi:hypothetical protein